jgi:hypothetical protein
MDSTHASLLPRPFYVGLFFRNRIVLYFWFLILRDLIFSFFILQRTEENLFYSYEFKRKQGSKLFQPVVIIWWVVCRIIFAYTMYYLLLTYWLVLFVPGYARNVLLPIFFCMCVKKSLQTCVFCFMCFDNLWTLCH